MAETPTGIISGLDKELRPYLNRLTRLAIHKVAGLELIEGELVGKRVVLVMPASGKSTRALRQPYSATVSAAA